MGRIGRKGDHNGFVPAAWLDSESWLLLALHSSSVLPRAEKIKSEKQTPILNAIMTVRTA